MTDLLPGIVFSLAIVGALVVAFAFGSATRRDVITEGCEHVGSFYVVGGKTFDCKPRTQGTAP